MFANRNTKYIYNKITENESREREKLLLAILLNSSLVLS